VFPREEMDRVQSGRVSGIPAWKEEQNYLALQIPSEGVNVRNTCEEMKARKQAKARINQRKHSNEKQQQSQNTQT
jgi:hypothetical protein